MAPPLSNVHYPAACDIFTGTMCSISDQTVYLVAVTFLRWIQTAAAAAAALLSAGPGPDNSLLFCQPFLFSHASLFGLEQLLTHYNEMIGIFVLLTVNYGLNIDSSHLFLLYDLGHMYGGGDTTHSSDDKFFRFNQQLLVGILHHKFWGDNY
ncbi:uncharacterized protein V6R79_012413 [Siganus canaliculatus]